MNNQILEIYAFRRNAFSTNLFGKSKHRFFYVHITPEIFFRNFSKLLLFILFIFRSKLYPEFTDFESEVKIYEFF